MIICTESGDLNQEFLIIKIKYVSTLIQITINQLVFLSIVIKTYKFYFIFFCYTNAFKTKQVILTRPLNIL